MFDFMGLSTIFEPDMFLIRSIYSILLTVIFLISAAGLHYTKHTCLNTDKVHIVLSQEEYTCCNAEAGACYEETVSCCEVTVGRCQDAEKESSDKLEVHENCCINNSRYLKTEDDYMAPEKAKLPGMEIHLTTAWLSVPMSLQSTPSVQERAHAPPEPYSSRKFLLQHGVLLI